MKLSEQTVAALHPVTKPTLIYDEALKGFGIRLMPPSTRRARGAQSWIVEYRTGTGGRQIAKKRVTLGSTENLTPEQARDMAAEVLASVRSGAGYPGAARANDKNDRTPPSGLLFQLHQLYSEESDPIRKAGTVTLYQGYWKNHILPALGDMSVPHVKRADIVRLHRAIGLTNKTTANRVLGLLSHFFKWAAKAGFVPGCRRDRHA